MVGTHRDGLVLAWDQALRWGKKEKKIGVGEKKQIGKRSEPRGSLERGKSGVALRHLPRPPLGSLRSPMFSLCDSLFIIFIPCEFII